MSRATSLASVGQQVSLATGVAIGALAVEMVSRLKGQPTITAADFPAAFILVGAVTALSTVLFARLPAQAGAEMADRASAPATTSSQGMS